MAKMIITNNLDVPIECRSDYIDCIILPNKSGELHVYDTYPIFLTCSYGKMTIYINTCYEHERSVEIHCDSSDIVVAKHIKRYTYGRVFTISISKVIHDSDANSTDNDNFDYAHDTYKKPPLGCITFDLTAGSRIHELASAIDRYSGETKGNTDLIRSWANEIILQCDLIDRMSDYLGGGDA